MTNWVLSLQAGSSSGGLGLFYNGRSLSRPHTKPLRGEKNSLPDSHSSPSQFKKTQSGKKEKE